VCLYQKKFLFAKKNQNNHKKMLKLLTLLILALSCAQAASNACIACEYMVAFTEDFIQSDKSLNETEVLDKMLSICSKLPNELSVLVKTRFWNFLFFHTSCVCFF
jgi:hypothetical protein